MHSLHHSGERRRHNVITMALLSLCNLAAIFLLSSQAVFLLNDYRKQKKEGKNPVFTKDKMPEIADKLEAW